MSRVAMQRTMWCHHRHAERVLLQRLGCNHVARARPRPRPSPRPCPSRECADCHNWRSSEFQRLHVLSRRRESLLRGGHQRSCLQTTPTNTGSNSTLPEHGAQVTDDTTLQANHWVVAKEDAAGRTTSGAVPRRRLTKMAPKEPFTKSIQSHWRIHLDTQKALTLSGERTVGSSADSTHTHTRAYERAHAHANTATHGCACFGNAVTSSE